VENAVEVITGKCS